MKFVLKILIFLFAMFTFGDESLSLSNYQIKKICKKEKRKSICATILKEKRSSLQKGNYVEIPVIPYKK